MQIYANNYTDRAILKAEKTAHWSLAFHDYEP